MHNGLFLLTTRIQKPSLLLGALLSMEASKSCRSADLSTQVGNHKPGVSYLAADPCLPSCLSLQQKLHVEMPLAAALVSEVPITQFTLIMASSAVLIPN